MIGPLWQAKAGCYSQAALYSNDSKTLYSSITSRVLASRDCNLVVRYDVEIGFGQSQSVSLFITHHDVILFPHPAYLPSAFQAKNLSAPG